MRHMKGLNKVYRELSVLEKIIRETDGLPPVMSAGSPPLIQCPLFVVLPMLTYSVPTLTPAGRCHLEYIMYTKCKI